MIVKMKRLRVIAMAGDRAKLLDGLLRLGCLENSWDATAEILRYLQEQRYTVVRPRETNPG